MEKQVFLSIIIPMYNSEKYITKTLKSVKNQIDKDFEILLIDDGSVDNSYKISEEYLKNSGMSYKIIKEKNLGQSVARNIGIKNSAGKYLLFLDSDDFIDEKLVSKLKKFSSNNEMVLFDYKRVNENGSVRNNSEQCFKFFNIIVDGLKVFYAYKNNEIRIWTSSVIYKREFILKNKINFLEGCHATEDLNFLFKSLVKAKNVLCIKDVLSYYFQRKASLSNNVNIKKNITLIKSMEDFCDFINDNFIDKKICKSIREEFIPEHIMYNILPGLKTDKKNTELIVKDKNVKKYLKIAKYNTSRYSKKKFILIKLLYFFPKILIIKYS